MEPPSLFLLEEELPRPLWPREELLLELSLVRLEPLRLFELELELFLSLLFGIFFKFDGMAQITRRRRMSVGVQNT